MVRDMNDKQLDADLQTIDAMLRRELPIDPPAGLADRIFQATADQLPSASDQREAVLARLRPNIVVRVGSWAMAAAVVIGVGLAGWLAMNDRDTTGDGAANQVAITDAQLETVALALAGTTDASGVQVDALAAEVESVALALFDIADDGKDLSELEDSLQGDLIWLETQIEQF